MNINRINQIEQGLLNMLEKSFQDIRQECGLPLLGGFIGISCDDSVKLEKMPENTLEENVQAGFYVNTNEEIRVEVHSEQRIGGGIVSFDILTPTGPMPSTCEINLFKMLFVKKDPDVSGLSG